MTNEIEHRPLADDEIDLRELFTMLWRGKWIITAFTFLFAIGSISCALSLPNIYKSEVLLAPSEDSQGRGLTGMVGGLGGLASFAGLSLGGNQADKTTIALEILKSRGFLTEFVEKHQILREIMAVKEWSPNQGLVFNEEIYDSQQDIWVQQAKPTSWEYVNHIRNNLLTITREPESGLIRLSIHHQSPIFAKRFVELLVMDINDEMRKRDINEAKRSLEFLANELKQTSLSNMQQVFFELIEKQTQTMMLANIRPEYIFQTIDPAIAPEQKVKPRRSLIVIVATALGTFFGAFFVLLRSTILKF
ncbi:LPS O-antigen length regulator [Pseudidiomarina tainanensis]|uniref:LPS O-antigen length regulator n=1 Tax=Pseudidiomarina tainanensis TaxID=502365 RepID=A0ACD2HJ78_9GAMM|nr:Wzz/FepE/Etk N-terminal domain-containing protein [Pseudidiomarina tainanensis]RZQ56282.1 LPS O-antigen length regulator [Pseudidiomarina tainanensis]